MFRTLTLLALLAALGYQLDREQREGRFQQADDLFLDFLLANARDRFVPDPDKASDQVVLVRMLEEEKKEYGAWPPPPIDWQIVLKGLVPFKPEVVVIATPLTWGQPTPEFVAEVGDALRPFPSVVLGVEGMIAKDDKDLKDSKDATLFLFRDAVPHLTRIDGNAALLPALTGITAMPDESIRRQMELGITPATIEPAGETSALPFVVRCGDIVAPSLMLQALSRYTRTPYARQRLRIGPGAGAHLGGGIYIPLTDDGQLRVNSSAAITSVNALNFMSGTLADSLTPDDKATLGNSKIIVIGIDSNTPQPTPARLQAAALGGTLSMPRIHAIGLAVRWIICAIAAALGCLLLRHRGGKALRTGFLLIFSALVVSFLTFQSNLTWFPPTVPAALLAASTFFAMLFGRKRVIPSSS